MKRDFFKRFERRIWLMTFLGFLNTAGFSLSLPFLTLYLYQVRGLPMTQVGLIILASGFGSAAAQIFAGALSDRFGRRPLLLGTVALSTLLYAVMAGLIGASASIWAIVLIYMAVRSSLMMMRPVIVAMVADVSSKDRLTEAYGLLRIGQNVGWAAGPAAGGYLVVFMPYSSLFYVAAAMGAAAFLFILATLRESLAGAAQRVGLSDLAYPARDGGFLAFTVLSLLVFLVMGQMSTTLSVFTVGHLGFSTAQYGLLLTMNGLIVVFFQYPVTRALGKLAHWRALVGGSLLYAVGYASMGVVGSFPAALVAMAVITCGEIIFSPSTLAVVGEMSPEAWRGHYMGFYSLSETLGLSFGPLIGGALLDGLPGSPMYVWGMIGLMPFLAAAGLYKWGRRLPPSWRR